MGVTFEKMLQTIASGCQSKMMEVAKLSLKTLKYIALDFRSNIELIKLSIKWFRSMNKGAKMVIQAFVAHQDITQQFLDCADAFIQDGELISYFFFDSLYFFIQDSSTYINSILHVFAHL